MFSGPPTTLALPPRLSGNPPCLDSLLPSSRFSHHGFPLKGPSFRVEVVSGLIPERGGGMFLNLVLELLGSIFPPGAPLATFPQ